MSNVSDVAVLVQIIFAEANTPVDEEQLLKTLVALDSHYLLRSMPKGDTPAVYHERVQRAYTEALDRIVRGEG